MYQPVESAWRAPRRLSAPLIAWRAERKTDPIAKLRYLRRSAEFRANRPVAKMMASSPVRNVSAMVLALGLLPIPTISDGAGMRRPVAQQMRTAEAEETAPARVWMVESTKDHEIFSNGLRIEKTYALAAGEPIRFLRVNRAEGGVEEARGPLGIVFHTTESHTLPFEEKQKGGLRRISAGVLQYVRQIRAYHYVIDRFGRVWRIVPENEPAMHAGNSVWGDDEFDYVDLNTSFLGVSFEGQSRDENGQTSANAAQIHAGRLLTDLLRSRYGIAGRNCVTHAQVSVNPANRGLGYHTDWAANFPFSAFGLPDNYRTANPAISRFGFRAEASFRAATGERVWAGVEAGEMSLERTARAERTDPETLRGRLAARYRVLHERLRQPDFSQEGN